MAADTGKFLYDVAAARVSAQAADQAALASRSKDLLGFATISTTVSGALVNDKLVNATKGSVPAWLFVAILLALVGVAGGALYVMLPRTWYLSPDPDAVVERVRKNLAAPTDDHWASMAMGLVTPNVVVSGISALHHNDAQLRRLRRAVIAQVVSIGVLAIAGALLAQQAVN